jgi:hypothetical protein
MKNLSLLLSTFAAAASLSLVLPAAQAQSLPSFGHVVIVLGENTAYNTSITRPTCRI